MTSFGDPGSRNANVVISADTAGYSQNVVQANRDTSALIGTLDKLSAKLHGLTHRTGTSLLHFAAADAAALGAVTFQAAAYDKQLSTLNATAAITGQRIGGVKKEIETLTRKFPESRGEAAQLVTMLSNLGITGSKNIGELAQTFIKLGAATGESVPQLATQLTQLSRQMGTGSTQLIAQYANALLTVSKNAGVSATGVLSFAQAIAPAARAAGIGEEKVLGISAAFSRAGADGYVAANTFNKILTDITRAAATGSPDLNKYANLIGKTGDQFKKMDQAEAFTEIFEQIAKQGPQAINILDRLGIDGVRAQQAVLAVTQQGGLRQSIEQAIGAAGDTGNLDKGSAAAMRGLSDSLEKLRNSFSQIGLEIGTTFLRPLTAATDGLTAMLQVANNLVRPLSAILGVFGLAAGGAAAIGGIGLHAAGLIGTAALARMALRSGPRTALREGIRDARAVAGGGAITSESAMRIAAGQLPLRARLAYRAGEQVGGLLGARREILPGASPTLTRQVVTGFLRAPFRTAAWYANEQSRFLTDAARNDYSRSFYSRGEGPSFPRRLGQMLAENRAAATGQVSAMRLVARESLNLGGAFARLTRTTVSTGLSMAGGRLGRGISALGGALFNPWTMLGMAGASWAVSRLQERRTATNITDDRYLNPIQKYNDQLGIATTNLAVFSAAVSKAAQVSLQGITATSSLTEVLKVREEDKLAAQGKKSDDEHINALRKVAGTQGPKTVAALSQLAGSYGMTDPRQVQLFKTNALAAGFTPDTVSQALAQSGIGSPDKPGTDYAALAEQVYRSQARGRFGGAFAANPSESGAKIRSAALTGIGQAYNENQRYGVGYAGQRRLSDELEYLSAYAGHISGSGKNVNIQQREMANTIAEIMGGRGAKQYLHAISGFDWGKMSEPDRQQAIIQVMSATPEGKQAIADVQAAGGTADVSQIAPTLGKLYSTGQQNRLTTAVQGTGPVGRFAAGSAEVQAAREQPGNTNAQYRAMIALYGQSMKVTGSFASTDQALQNLKAAINDTNDPLYQLADAAKSYAAEQQSYRLPTMSRQAQLGQAVAGYEAAAGSNPLGQDFEANLKATRTNFEQQKESYRQYLISIDLMVRQYGIARRRQDEDRDTQLGRHDRDFRKSMLRNQEDFNRSRLRSEQDFAKQMTRSAEDAAKNWYNPWERVPSEYTNSGESVLRNLTDQNERIQKQMSQLGQLSQMGLSTQAIQTLNLASPEQAQQVNTLVESLANNPQLIAQINAAIATRLKGVAAITQSGFSDTFTRTMADYRQQFQRASEDFNRSRDRAVADNQTALDDMATDYARMVDRSAQDMKDSLREVTGDFGTVFNNTVKQIAASLGKLSPDVAKAFDTALAPILHDPLLKKLLDPNYKPPPQQAKPGDPNFVGPLYTPPTKPKPGEPGFVGPVYVAPSNLTAAKPKPEARAEGGIFSRPFFAENSPEMALPLNERGHQYMAGMYQAVAKSVAQQMRTAGRGLPTMYGGASTTVIDSSVTFSGAVHVQANDPNAMARQLAQKARLRRLTRPPRAAIGAS